MPLRTSTRANKKLGEKGTKTVSQAGVAGTVRQGRVCKAGMAGAAKSWSVRGHVVPGGVGPEKSAFRSAQPRAACRADITYPGATASSDEDSLGRCSRRPPETRTGSRRRPGSPGRRFSRPQGPTERPQQRASPAQHSRRPEPHSDLPVRAGLGDSCGSKARTRGRGVQPLPPGWQSLGQEPGRRTRALRRTAWQRGPFLRPPHPATQ